MDWTGGIETAPRPRDGTLARVVGRTVNGMRVYRVLDLRNGGRQFGPDCMTWAETEQRLDDLHTGRRVIWLGGVRFVRERAAQSPARDGGDGNA